MTFLGVELCFAVIALAIGFSKPYLCTTWFQRIEDVLGSIARRRRLSVAAVGVLALAIRLAVLPILPVPEPGVHDEFSHLLLADTFAHGRITNPTHPMWEHFETFHEIQKPSYASMYPPAQGLILALGQVVFGHPFWGVWLSVGFMCAALCWMLQAWLSEGWALFGGLFAVVRFGTFSYWADSYWGGALIATGSALVLGALPRIKSSQKIRDALLMALGLGMLANTRPFEGLVFSLPVATALLAWILSGKKPFAEVYHRVILPLSLLLIVIGVATGFYFYGVTGSPFRMPYEINRATYAVAPYFMWQSPRSLPIYHHREMQTFYAQWELQQFADTRNLIGVAVATLGKANIIWLFYIGPLFLLTILVALAVAPQQLRWQDLHIRTRFLLAAAAFNAAGMFLEVFFAAHKAAASTCLLLALLLIAMRYLRAWRYKNRPAGLAMVRAVSFTGVLLLGLRIIAQPLHLPTNAAFSHTWCTEQEGNTRRAAVIKELQQHPGKQLVIVRYRPEHNVHEEWVYNSSDIDDSKIVWARDMGRKNDELIAYFKEREVWFVDPDYETPRLVAFDHEAPEVHSGANGPDATSR